MYHTKPSSFLVLVFVFVFVLWPPPVIPSRPSHTLTVSHSACTLSHSACTLSSPSACCLHTLHQCVGPAERPSSAHRLIKTSHQTHDGFSQLAKASWTSNWFFRDFRDFRGACMILGSVPYWHLTAHWSHSDAGAGLLAGWVRLGESWLSRRALCA